MMDIVGIVLMLSSFLADSGVAEQPSGRGNPGTRVCILIEVFTRENSEQCSRVEKFLTELAKRRSEVRVTYHDVVRDEAALKRLHELCRRHRVTTAGVPGILLCDQFLVGYRDDETTGRRIEELLKIEVFTREGCPHCAKAKEFLAELSRRNPGLKIEIYDVVKDAVALRRMQVIAERQRVQVPSLPMFSMYGRVLVGFWEAESSGREIEKIVESATVRCSIEEPTPPAQSVAPHRDDEISKAVNRMGLFNHGRDHWTDAIRPTTVPIFAQTTSQSDIPPEAIPEPIDAFPGEIAQPEESTPTESRPPDEVAVPLVGRLRASELGMPAFTFLLGLVDGFNPCAMWVLIFLLSVLVNLKDRRRVLLIAGTFIVISGLAYFAFMAAWLNVFLLIGFARSAQVALGLMAALIGVVNVKDFVAFGRGLSFSIPDSAKPGIYARVRQIVAARFLTTALIGAIVLAVLVNTIELLCTAGLPALYTQILTFQEYPAWKNYLYLGLYNVAYMFDDTIMLTIAVVTLSHRKLQEREGRWLKLVSGVVIFALGLMLLFKPEWLA